MPVDKSGRFYVVGPVPLLHPEAQTVAEMLEGWRNQQLCRNLAHDTIGLVGGRAAIADLGLAKRTAYRRRIRHSGCGQTPSGPSWRRSIDVNRDHLCCDAS